MRLPFAFLVKEESDDLLTQVAGNRHNLPLPHSEEKFGMSSRTCVFVARRIITMNPSLPSTTHVAVRDRRILGYGDADAVGRFADAEIDGRFADKFIMPGFVEGHCHLFEGALWRDPYLGFFDRRGPDGRMWPGLKSIDSVVVRLRQHEKRMTDADAPVSGWGFDPIFFGGRRMNRGDLDRVSTLVAVNSSAKADVTKTREDRLRDGARHDAKREYVAPCIRSCAPTRRPAERRSTS